MGHAGDEHAAVVIPSHVGVARADGRVVARLLAARGARVQVFDAATAPATLPR